ncbi:MAG: MBL fold metallo-hydrolase [Eubacteriales bacterium]|nr:MBL fold metallo-hydrolase [Eubacteriales bacterium]
MFRYNFKKSSFIFFIGIGITAGLYNPVLAAENEAKPKYAVYSKDMYDGPGSFGGVNSPETTNVDGEHVLSGGEMRFLTNKGSDSQQLSAILKSSDGKIVVVDGGVSADTDHLLQNIKEMGGYVDAWLITHPQQDHIGALTEILNNRSTEIDIRNIYYNFHEPEWYQEVDPEECGIVFVLNDALSKYPQDRVHGEISKGTLIELSDKLTIKVMNDPVKMNDVYAVNNSSLMYDICIDGKHVIILGDMGPVAGRQLMNEGVLEGVTADFVQISHHGQNGVDEEFYKRLNPKNCIWPTTKWLYNVQTDNQFGFKTNETKAWIDKLNTEHNYTTKDEDVIIF